MIYTVNWNPAMDLALELNAPLSPDKIYSQAPSWWRAGGKGSNAARAMAAWQAPVTLVGFFGGALGEMIEDELDRSGISCLSAPASGQSRLCITLTDAMGQVTEIREAGPTIERAEADRLLGRLCARVQPSDWVTMNGSLPPGLDASVVQEWIAVLKERVKGILVDMRGPSLIGAWHMGASLVSPNAAEYEEASTDLSFAANPSGHLMITQGSSGIRWRSPDGVFYRIQVPKVPLVNPVGAGDVFLGTVAAFLHQGETWENAILMGAAAATASVTTQAVADFKVVEAKRLRQKVEIRQEEAGDAD